MPKIDVENPRITYARIKIEVDGKEYLCKSVSYGDSIERSDIEGNAQMSLGVSDGMYKTDDGEIAVFADEFAELVMAFGDKFFEKNFDVSVTYEKKGSSQLTKDELKGCRFTKRAVSDEAGADALSRSVGFKPAYIKFNGQNPLSKMPDGAA